MLSAPPPITPIINRSAVVQKKKVAAKRKSKNRVIAMVAVNAVKRAEPAENASAKIANAVITARSPDASAVKTANVAKRAGPAENASVKIANAVITVRNKN